MKHLHAITKKHKTILFIIAGILIIAVSVTLAFAVNMINVSNQNATKENASKIIAERIAEVQQKTNEAEKQVSNGDLNGAIATYDKAIESTSDNITKADYYTAKSSLLYDNDDKDAALAAAKQALILNNSASAAAFIGRIYYINGDISSATEYYKKAKDLIDPNGPTVQDDKDYYQSIVSGLEKDGTIDE